MTGNSVTGLDQECIEVDCFDVNGGECSAGRVADNYVVGSTDDNDVRSGIVCNHGNWND